MNFLIVDDEPMALRDLKQALTAAVPDCEIFAFSSPVRALAQAEAMDCHVAFLDIEMGSSNGLVLAKKLKDMQPDLHIIFVTSYAKYAVDAFRIHATGYLLKPVSKEGILRELTFLYGKEIVPQKKIRVQTFGGFEVFVNDVPLTFKRSKAKELLALLIDRRGASLTAAEICAFLWENESAGQSQKSYLRTLVTELKAALCEAGIADAFVKRHNSYSIVPDKLYCDSYRFIAGEPQAINNYRHDYLPAYSWAELSVPMFEIEM